MVKKKTVALVLGSAVAGGLVAIYLGDEARQAWDYVQNMPSLSEVARHGFDQAVHFVKDNKWPIVAGAEAVALAYFAQIKIRKGFGTNKTDQALFQGALASIDDISKKYSDELKYSDPDYELLSKLANDRSIKIGILRQSANQYRTKDSKRAVKAYDAALSILQSKPRNPEKSLYKIQRSLDDAVADLNQVPFDTNPESFVLTQIKTAFDLIEKAGYQPTKKDDFLLQAQQTLMQLDKLGNFPLVQAYLTYVNNQPT
ncbi:MAG: hypothetical protein ABIJ08_07135 [Nanoarchaeota archaeon]